MPVTSPVQGFPVPLRTLVRTPRRTEVPAEITHTDLAPTIDLTMGVYSRDLGHVAEGVWTAPEVARRARAAGVEMPITDAVCGVLAGTLTPRTALGRLLARDPRREGE